VSGKHGIVNGGGANKTAWCKIYWVGAAFWTYYFRQGHATMS